MIAKGGEDLVTAAWDGNWVSNWIEKIPSAVAAFTTVTFLLSVIHNIVLFASFDIRMVSILIVADILAISLGLMPLIGSFGLACASYILFCYLVPDGARGWLSIAIGVLAFGSAAISFFFRIAEGYCYGSNQLRVVLNQLLLCLMFLVVLAYGILANAKVRKSYLHLFYALLVFIAMLIPAIALGVTNRGHLETASKRKLVTEDGSTETVVLIRAVERGVLFWSHESQKPFFLPWDEIRRF